MPAARLREAARTEWLSGSAAAKPEFKSLGRDSPEQLSQPGRAPHPVTVSVALAVSGWPGRLGCAGGGSQWPPAAAGPSLP